MIINKIAEMAPILSRLVEVLGRVSIYSTPGQAVIRMFGEEGRCQLYVLV